MVLPRIAAQWIAKRMISTSKPRLSDSSSGVNKGRLLNIIGLPAVGVILFFMLPTVRPGEIHGIEHYYRNPRWEEKNSSAGKEA